MAREIKSDAVSVEEKLSLANGVGLIARNAANTADISIAIVDGSDELILGDQTAGTFFVMTTGGMNVVVGNGTGTIDQLSDELFLQGGTHNAYLSFYDLANGKKLSLTAFAGLTADTRWVLPNGNGSAGQVLGTDGASPVANLSWVNQTGGGGGGSSGTGVGVNVPNLVVPAGTPTQMLFTSADAPIDTGGYTVTANTLTVPALGFYWLNINSLTQTPFSSNLSSFGYSVNGGPVVYFVGDTSNGQLIVPNGSQLLYLSATDQITLWVLDQSGQTYFDITVGLASTAGGTVPTSGSGANMSGGSQSVTTATPLTFNATAFDTGGYTVTADSFTVPATDLYTLEMRAQTSSIGTTGTLQIGYSINGGGPVFVDLVNTTNITSSPYGLGNSELVSLNQGDVVTFVGDCNIGGIFFGDIVVGITRAANVGPDGYEIFALTNNQVSPADITGLVLDHTVAGSYDVWLYTYYNTTGTGATEGGASGFYNFAYLPVAGTWGVVQNGTNGYGTFDSVVLTVTNAGQVQYTNSDVTNGGTTGTAVGTYNFYWQIAAPGTAGGGGGGGANQHLSNLLSPVAVNQHFSPGADLTYNLGDTTHSWQLANIEILQNTSAQTVIDVYGYLLRGSGTVLSVNWDARQLHDAGGGASLDWSNGSILIPLKPFVFDGSGEVSTTGATQADLLITTNNQAYAALGAGLNSGNLSIITGNTHDTGNTGTLSIGSGSSNSGGTGDTGDVSFGSGSTDGTGVSGNVLIASGDTPGTSGDLTLHTGIDGVRGKIRFTNGTEGVPGWVWTQTDAGGAGEWMPLNGGGVSGFSGPVALTNNQGSSANIAGFKLDASVSHAYDFWFYTYYNTTGPGATEGGTGGFFSFNYLPTAGTWTVTTSSVNGYGAGDSLPPLTVLNSGQVQYTTSDVTNGGTTGTAVGSYNFFWEISAPNSAGGFSSGNGASIHATAQTPTINTPWQITFSSVSFDTNNFTIANPNSFTVSRANRYDLNIHISSSVIAIDGTVQIRYTINNTGGGVIDQVNTRSGISRPYDINGSVLLDLNPNDTVQAWIEDDIGGITYVGDVSLAEYGGGAAGEASGVSIAAPTFTTAGGFIDEQIVFTSAGAFFDTSQYSSTANQLTVPSTTQYWLSVTAQIASPTGSLELGYSINASAVAYMDQDSSANTLSFTTLLDLTQGDAIKLWFNAQNSDVIAPIRIDLGRQGGGGAGGGTPAGVDGAVQFNASGAFGADDATFHWDNTNKRLGIGTNTPNESLEVAGAVRATSTAGTNVANAADFDWDGAARIISRGPNTSTAGDIQFNVVSSDASIDMTAMVVAGTGNIGIGTLSPSAPLHIESTVFGSNVANLLINVTGTGGGEVDAIILNSDGNTGMKFKNSVGGTTGTYVGFEGGPSADFQINNGDTGKITLWTNGIRSLAVNADTSISFHADLMEINPSITFNALGPGSFFGNISDNDQTVHQVVFGSTDTAVATNLTSSLFIQTGTNTFAGSTANTGSVNIAPGEIVNGSGNPGQLLMYGGSVGIGSSNGGVALLQGGFADSGNGGIVTLVGGGSNTGQGGTVTISSGTGATRGTIQLQDGSEGTSGWVWTSTDAAGTGAWVPGAGLPAPLEATASYTNSVLMSSVGTFVGNISDNDQTNFLVQYGSTDTLVAGNNTSNVAIISGSNNVNAGSSVTGTIYITTGGLNNATATGESGNLELWTGHNAGSGSSGTLELFTGNAGLAGSGSLQMFTGSTSSTGPIGGISISTGTNVSASGIGPIQLITGTGPSRGQIQFMNGTEGTAGYVWTSTDVNGSGSWMPGASSTWQSLDWFSNDSAGCTLFAAQPSIVGDSTLTPGFAFNIFTTDIPLTNTTNQGANLQIGAGSVLEPTSTLNGGSVQIGAGWVLGGSGSPGVVTLNGGSTTGSGNGGNVELTAGNASTGLGGNVVLATGTGSPQGLIQFQDGTQGPVGYVWTSVDGVGSGHWVPGNVRISRILNSGSNTINVATDFKLLCDTTDAAATTALLPAGSDNMTFRLAGIGGGAFSYTVTPNGGDLIDPSAPTVISAGTVVEYTYLLSTTTWYAS